MKHRDFERGQTLPLLAVTALVLVGIAGFAADVGYHQYEQRVQQTATDSAALAAAAELNLSLADAQTAGKNDATSNGFTDGKNNVSVTINPPASPDPYTGVSGAVEADIQAVYPTFFEHIFSISSVSVETKAVAITNAHSNLCMVALDTNGTTNIDAHSVIKAPNCDIAVNNANLSIGGQSTITTANPIQYSGKLTGAGTSTFSPSAPVSGLPLSDPCPQITSCLYLQQNPPNTTPCINYSGSGPLSPYPTIYCKVKFSNGSTINLSPGLYVITGSFDGGSSTINGTGVTLVFTGTNNFSANNATLNLSAPTSGDYNGLAIYAPNETQPVVLNSGNLGLDGVVYFPKANLTMNSGSISADIIIAGQLTLNSSNTTFSAPSNIWVTVPRLVE